MLTLITFILGIYLGLFIALTIETNNLRRR